MSKFGRKQRPAPEGFDFIEPTLTALDNELRESKCGGKLCIDALFCSAMFCFAPFCSVGSLSEIYYI